MGKYAKFVIAAVTAALVAVSDLLPVGSAVTQYINLALTIIGAIAVLRVPNASASARSAATADERYHQPGM